MPFDFRKDTMLWLRALYFCVDAAEVVSHLFGHDRPCNFVCVHFFLAQAAHGDHAVAVGEVVDAALEGEAEHYNSSRNECRGDDDGFCFH